MSSESLIEVARAKVIESMKIDILTESQPDENERYSKEVSRCFACKSPCSSAYSH